MTIAFTELLKNWRNMRRMSQLDLGLLANVSARHVSFLETGKAAPSRQMVLQLCETLAVPIQTQNEFLNAAGFANIFPSGSLNDIELRHARQAIDWTLQQHSPYPALALDKHWTVIGANHTANLLLTAVGMKQGDSILHAMQHSQLLRQTIINWPDVAQHLVARLRTESTRLGQDAILNLAADGIAQLLPVESKALPQQYAAVLTTQYQINGKIFSLFSMLAQFGSADDIALADLKIELMFPADQATREFLLSLPKPDGAEA